MEHGRRAWSRMCMCTQTHTHIHTSTSTSVDLASSVLASSTPVLCTCVPYRFCGRRTLQQTPQLLSLWHQARGPLAVLVPQARSSRSRTLQQNMASRLTEHLLSTLKKCSGYTRWVTSLVTADGPCTVLIIRMTRVIRENFVSATGAWASPTL